MSILFRSPQPLLGGSVGKRIEANSAVEPCTTEVRWQHYADIARAREGHLYAVVFSTTSGTAMCVDDLRDFALAADAEATTGKKLRYFVLTQDEHAQTA